VESQVFLKKKEFIFLENFPIYSSLNANKITEVAKKRAREMKIKSCPTHSLLQSIKERKEKRKGHMEVGVGFISLRE
jgi:hypothetical protein